jgi:hypothetical protein
MTSTCATPLSDEQLIAYWAGDLDDDASATVEDHLFSCLACTAACERIAAIAETIRELIPPIVSRDQVARLQAKGLHVVENRVAPGQRKACVFRPGTDILLHVLHGLDLGRIDTVDVIVSDEDSGTIFFEAQGVPFDRASGEVLVACQRHFSSFPPNVVFDVRTRDSSGAERSTLFAIPHVFG